MATTSPKLPLTPEERKQLRAAKLTLKIGRTLVWRTAFAVSFITPIIRTLRGIGLTLLRSASGIGLSTGILLLGPVLLGMSLKRCRKVPFHFAVIDL